MARFSTLGSSEERRDEVALHFDPAAQPNPAMAFDPAAPLRRLSEPRVGRMPVEGIPGESSLVLDAWNVSEANPTLFGPFVVSKAVDGASPALLVRHASGQHISKVTIKLLQPGSDTIYTTYELTDVVVAGDEPIRSCWDRRLNAGC